MYLSQKQGSKKMQTGRNNLKVHPIQEPSDFKKLYEHNNRKDKSIIIDAGLDTMYIMSMSSHTASCFGQVNFYKILVC